MEQLPVWRIVASTIGTIIGGVALVGLLHWFVYQQPQRSKQD